jgi:hypothetical protein
VRKEDAYEYDKNEFLSLVTGITRRVNEARLKIHHMALTAWTQRIFQKSVCGAPGVVWFSTPYSLP